MVGAQDDRWFDFNEPTAPAGSGLASSFGDDTSFATWCHLVPLVTGVFGATVMFVAARNRPLFARHHAAEALNFQITLLIGVIASAVLMSLLIGFVTLIAMVIAAIAFQITGAFRASEGIWWRYPISIRLVPGALHV